MAAEFALILPVLAMLLFGMIQMGIAFQRFQTVHSAAREGARVGSLASSSNGDIINRCQAALAGTNFDSAPSCTIVSGDCTNHNGDIVVQATAQNVITIPFFPNQTVTLTGRGEFRCE